jgi:hypothetical protein
MTVQKIMMSALLLCGLIMPSSMMFAMEGRKHKSGSNIYDSTRLSRKQAIEMAQKLQEQDEQGNAEEQQIQGVPKEEQNTPNTIDQLFSDAPSDDEQQQIDLSKSGHFLPVQFNNLDQQKQHSSDESDQDGSQLEEEHTSESQSKNDDGKKIIIITDELSAEESAYLSKSGYTPVVAQNEDSADEANQNDSQLEEEHKSDSGTDYEDEPGSVTPPLSDNEKQQQEAALQEAQKELQNLLNEDTKPEKPQTSSTNSLLAASEIFAEQAAEQQLLEQRKNKIDELRRAVLRNAEVTENVSGDRDSKVTFNLEPEIHRYPQMKDDQDSLQEIERSSNKHKKETDSDLLWFPELENSSKSEQFEQQQKQPEKEEQLNPEVTTPRTSDLSQPSIMPGGCVKPLQESQKSPENSDSDTPRPEDQQKQEAEKLPQETHEPELEKKDSSGDESADEPEEKPEVRIDTKEDLLKWLEEEQDPLDAVTGADSKNKTSSVPSVTLKPDKPEEKSGFSSSENSDEDENCKGCCKEKSDLDSDRSWKPFSESDSSSPSSARELSEGERNGKDLTRDDESNESESDKIEDPKKSDNSDELQQERDKDEKPGSGDDTAGQESSDAEKKDKALSAEEDNNTPPSGNADEILKDLSLDPKQTIKRTFNARNVSFTLEGLAQKGNGEFKKIVEKVYGTTQKSISYPTFVDAFKKKYAQEIAKNEQLGQQIAELEKCVAKNIESDPTSTTRGLNADEEAHLHEIEDLVENIYKVVVALQDDGAFNTGFFSTVMRSIRVHPVFATLGSLAALVTGYTIYEIMTLPDEEIVDSAMSQQSYVQPHEQVKPAATAPAA